MINPLIVNNYTERIKNAFGNRDQYTDSDFDAVLAAIVLDIIAEKKIPLRFNRKTSAM